MREMTPREVVAELDAHIIGQDAAKRAVAIAIRNRWRWRQLDAVIRKEVTPKNIIMIGPTGVGKTEITRRLATLTGAPFIKIEATKYTEVGYYGRDVESMVRDLVEASIKLVETSKRIEVEEEAARRVEDRLVDLMAPLTPEWDSASTDEENADESADRHARTQEKFRKKLRAGELEERVVELQIETRNSPVQMFSNMGMEQMDVDFQSMFEKIVPKQSQERTVKVSDARKILLEQEIENLLDKDAVNEEAIALAEDTGIIFVDEIDKICSGEGGSSQADVSRQGVQRDLLPIVEGTNVQTRYGTVNTSHILFIAAGAFHRSKPSDLMPELQGRFPIRVELTDLTRDDFIRILTEPTSSLTKQYEALLATDNIKLQFSKDGLEAMADIAYQVNQSTQNIGARRLHTIMERLLEEISFEAPDMKKTTIKINAAYVQDKLKEVVENEDLSRFIL
ncbi:ATP-dependent protease ATPase subunit ClpY [Symmachiella dynata]|uniref:ATP-dependent protease ATPase subunit HslU n=1 Tax=Symmachiella dynata TaxID=2527995 RepID=A0A517ZU14_9PLAN|nr:ATP-dependent protease ATPase subunit ClpY [Symmachiella dynata]